MVFYVVNIISALFWVILTAFLYTHAANANIADYSINQPSFPPAGLTLLQTVAADPSRRSITMQNQSANSVEIWRDQTCSGTGLSLIVLVAAPAAGGMGGTWTANDYTGCFRIYGTAGSQLAIFSN